VRFRSIKFGWEWHPILRDTRVLARIQLRKQDSIGLGFGGSRGAWGLPPIQEGRSLKNFYNIFGFSIRSS